LISSAVLTAAVLFETVHAVIVSVDELWILKPPPLF
jgi:hypothetical protein